MYIPVLRYRLAEKRALKTLGMNNVFSSKKIIPLLEIIQHYPTGRTPQRPKSFEQVYTEEFQGFSFPVIIDFPTYINLNANKIEERYRTFLRDTVQYVDIRINYMLRLSKLPNVIPSITYNPGTSFNPGTLLTQAAEFRKSFKIGIVCFRIFPNAADIILDELKKSVMSGDIVLLDLQGDNYRDSKLDEIYLKLYYIKKSVKCKIGLIHSAITEKFQNSTIENGTVIPRLDASLINLFKDLDFDCYSDYAGIKKDLLLESFRGFITNLYYCSSINKYVGFTAKPSKDPKDYAAVIAPSILSSSYYKSYSVQHHRSCPGCIEIADKAGNLLHPGNRSTWKSISIEHYIYSLFEML
jgi:hypothetical protein